MAGLITYDSARRLQDMSDQLRGLSAGGSGAGVGGTTLRHRTSTFANTRTGYAYGAIPGLSGGQPGVGAMKFDRLNIDTLQFGNEDSDTNPRTVYNLTTVQIPDGSRLIAWRDGTAEDEAGAASAWYVGGTEGGGDTIIAMPLAVLTHTGEPHTIFASGGTTNKMLFAGRRTNDSTTFGFVNGQNDPNPAGLADGILVKRQGDYLIRWTIAAEINGAQSMAGAPAQGTEIDYIIGRYEVARWNMYVKAEKRNPLGQVAISDPTTPCTLVYFCDFQEAKTFSGQEDIAFQPDRIVSLLPELVTAYNSFDITRYHLEVMRLGGPTTAPV